MRALNNLMEYVKQKSEVQETGLKDDGRKEEIACKPPTSTNFKSIAPSAGMPPIVDHAKLVRAPVSQRTYAGSFRLRADAALFFTITISLSHTFITPNHLLLDM
jgi:hypothetical protein